MKTRPKKNGEMFCTLGYNAYLCTVQLVILIYIYHFPKGNLSVKIDYLFSFMVFSFLLMAMYGALIMTHAKTAAAVMPLFASI